MCTQSPIKVQESPFLVQQENVLKRETPSKFRERQSPNFVHRDNCGWIGVQRKEDSRSACRDKRGSDTD